MKTNYVLIDYENVKPKSLSVLHDSSDHDFRVLLFLGTDDKKIPIELTKSMQVFGKKAEYIQICGMGKNNLDFHIAAYLGKLSVMDPEGCFHVISKDTGYDNLIKHLKGNGVEAARRPNIFNIPLLSSLDQKTKGEDISPIIKNLSSRGSSRPRRKATLERTINALFNKKLDQERLSALVKELEKRGYVTVGEGNRVTYPKFRT